MNESRRPNCACEQEERAQYEQLQALLDQHRGQPEALIQVLRRAQDHYFTHAAPVPLLGMNK